MNTDTSSGEVEIRYLGDVQRLELKPSDVVVVTVDLQPSDAQITHLRAYLKSLLGRTVLVLPKGWTIAAIGELATADAGTGTAQ